MKTFLMKKMLSSKLGGVPQADQDKLFSMIEKNPGFFEKIVSDVQESMKTGKDQMTATMETVKKYETQLKGLL